ncbi:hypothetical protein [Chitinophaga silvatica]|nr:hypothetical protein [Chitinophaga silvatica]
MFAFTDSQGDLRFTLEEYKGVNAIFESAKNAEKRSEHGATKVWINNTLNELKYNPPSILHFSGHASTLGLSMQNNEKQTGLDLAAILKNNKIRILFLNGCCTSSLVKEIFAHENAVEAIIATRVPVQDFIACELSLSFYNAFITMGETLQGAFNEMYSLHSRYSLKKELKIWRFDEVEEDLYIDFDTAENFSWVIFSKNAKILNCTIDTLLDDSSKKVAEIDEEIKRLNDVLAKEERALNRIDKNDEQLKEDREYCEYKVASLLEEIRLKKQKKKNLLDDKFRISEDAIANEHSAAFTMAVENLNYKSQRKGLRINKAIGGIVMSGDEDSMLELLFRHFKSENNIRKENTEVYLFDDKSPFFGSFWARIAIGDKRNMQDVDFTVSDKQEIVYNIMREIFCAGGDTPHQNILFKVVCTHTELTLLEAALEEIWKLIHEYLVKENLSEKMKSWKYKIVFLLMDETGVQERKTAFDALVKRLKSNSYMTHFEVLEKVECMEQEVIYKWLDNQQQLSRMGFRLEHAEELFIESQGAIKKFLSIIKRRVNFEVSLLDELKIH